MDSKIELKINFRAKIKTECREKELAEVGCREWNRQE